MKKRIIVTLGLTATLLGSMYVYASPATIYSDLVGIEKEEAYELRRESGKTFGQLASEEGKFEEFKAGLLEEKIKSVLNAVEAGKITQEKADEIIEDMTERIENCNPEDPIRLGRGMMKGRQHRVNTRLALEEGDIEEFKATMLEEKTKRILSAVESGKITQEEADDIIEKITERIENCDPENPTELGFGGGMMQGKGQGRGYNAF